MSEYKEIRKIMSKQTNTLIVQGTLGRDPEYRTAGENLIATISIANNRPKKVGDGWEDKTSWFRCVGWGRIAEQMQKLELAKGMEVLIQGPHTTHSYLDKENKTQTAWELTIQEFTLLTKRDRTQQGDGYNSHPAAASNGVNDLRVNERDTELEPEDIPF